MPRGAQEVVRRSPVRAVAKSKSEPQPESLVASARVYDPANAARMLRKGGNQRARSREWQHMLWDFYDMVPEYRSGCDWVGNSLSKAKIYITKNGQRVDDEMTRTILRSFFGGIEGQAEMLRLFGVNFSVAGEAWIVGEPGHDGGADSWRVIAATEVTGEDATGARHLNIEGERAKPDVLPIRIWKAHARRSEEANSPSRALLSTLNQIVKLTQVIDAQADSRLISAGVLFVPSEIEVPNMTMTVHHGDGTETVKQVESGQALYQMLVDNASVAIEKRDSAAAQVPIVISAPGEHLEKVNHVEFWSGFDEYVKELRDEAIRRIAVGMDMPPEVLTGTADVNHWGAWQIEEAAIKSYMEPLLDIIVSSLTTGYLRPLLKSWGVEDYDTYEFKADTSQMRLRPNRSKEAIELWDRGVISTRTMLIENGFDPDSDAMPAEEKVLWLIQKVGTGNTNPEMVAHALELLNIRGMVDAARAGQSEAGDEARPTRSLEQHPHRGAPNPEESEAEDAVVASAAVIPLDGLVFACEQMVFRALERAGNRIKTQSARSQVFKAAAMDLYQVVPQPSRNQCAELLHDAWSTLDRFDYPGVERDDLRRVLNGYATSLLRTQRPYTRESLSRYLEMELAA